MVPSNKVQMFEVSIINGATPKLKETWWVNLFTNVTTLSTILGSGARGVEQIASSSNVLVAGEVAEATWSNVFHSSMGSAARVNGIVAAASFTIKFAASSYLF